MKKSLLVMLALCTFSMLRAQFYYQYFDYSSFSNLTVNIDTSATNIWQIGQPQKTLFSSASSTPNVMVTDLAQFYPANNISSFRFKVTTAPAWSTPLAVRWKQKLDFDAGKDGGIVEFSMNKGLSWQNAHNNPNTYQFYGFMPANKDTLTGNIYAFSGTDTVWRDIWLCIKPSVLSQSDTILFRFTVRTDSINKGKEGWMIDNLLAYYTHIHPVKEISQIDDIVVFPNVTSGIVNVELRKTEESPGFENIELLNDLGKKLVNYGPNYSKVVLDISKYPNGIYYLKTTVNKKSKQYKVILEK